jgi:hypothetical protein
MDDLELITSLRPEIELPAAGQLTAARGRLDAVIAAAGPPAGPVAGKMRRAPGPRRTRRRLVIAAAVAAAAAAGVTTGVAMGPSGSASVPTVSAAAAHTLNLAAAAALGQPGPQPRPDQFVYSATRDGGGHLYQSWLSVDGTRTGLVRGIGGTPGWSYVPGCRDGREQLNAPVTVGGTKGPQPCTPDPAYLPALPTSAAAMGRYLQRTQKLSLGSPVADLDSLGKGVSDLLEDVYLSPRQLAAVYQFMADTPGFTVVPNAADARGRRGIGIRWPVADGQVADPGYTAMIIFNPRTGAFLGQRTTYRGESPAVYSGDAVVQRAVVDQPGQLPLGGAAR